MGHGLYTVQFDQVFEDGIVSGQELKRPDTVYQGLRGGDVISRLGCLNQQFCQENQNIRFKFRSKDISIDRI